MARAAFLADRALRALGISGRAFIPLVMGLGCTTTAVVCARGVDDERDRRMTILLIAQYVLRRKTTGIRAVCRARFGRRAAGADGNRADLSILALCAAGACRGALLARHPAKRRDKPRFVMELAALPACRTLQPALRPPRGRARQGFPEPRAGTADFCS